MCVRYTTHEPQQAGCARHLSRQFVVGVSEERRSLPEEMVVHACEKCCISNALDGTENDMLWEAASAKQSSSEESSNSFED